MDTNVSNKMNIKSITDIYKQTTNMRRKYADLKKCELHLHTPASYDYCLIPNKKFTSLTIEDVLDYCGEIGYLNKELIENIKLSVKKGEYDGIKYVEQLNEKSIPYENFKEYLAYMAIAHKLYDEKIEVALISDHNTFSGYKKLKFALEHYYKDRVKNGYQKNRKAIYLLLGVEVSCSDKNHVVVIFDDKQLIVAERFLNEFIYSTSEGTIETSLTVIKEAYRIGGIGYLAHINSSDFLGTGLYKQNLFSANKILGSTNLNVMDSIIEKNISPFCNSDDFCILHEGDSHHIEAIGVKNSWIRLNELNFSVFKKALNDFHFSVYTEKPLITDKFIKGIYIDPGEKGFLRGKDSKSLFIVDFSKDLNCIIGGRGTGKSTLLNIIDTVFSLTTMNMEQLKFISEHKFIVVVFTYKGLDYVIRFIPQLDPHKRYYSNDFFLEKAFNKESMSANNMLIELESHWLELFRVQKGKEIILVPVKHHEKDEILKSVYRNRYSINNIIQKINSRETGNFVKEVIFDGLPSDFLNNFLNELRFINKRKIRGYLVANLPAVIKSLEERKQDVFDQISDFNFNNSDTLEIVHGHNVHKDYLFIDDLLFNKNLNKNLSTTLLKWSDVESFLYTLMRKVDYISFLYMMVSQRFAEIEKVLSIAKFQNKSSNQTQKDVEEEFEEITNKNLTKVYKEILWGLISNRSNLISSLERYFKISDDFNILFNVNSKESFPNQGVLLKSIEELSLGQKVAAALTFIFRFGIHANDNTPLIIDQPEDNLDSQYIYKNLVRSLREIKNTRQVIVVTHNSTIVTNAAAEQVIVLNSDNTKGWVEKKGYQGNPKITKMVLQYLEGGQESFLHKMKTYNTILNLQIENNIPNK